MRTAEEPPRPPTHGIALGAERGGRSSTSSGLLPYAPHMRLNFPVSASYTITRLLPYPSDDEQLVRLGVVHEARRAL